MTELLAFLTNKEARSGIVAGGCSLLASYVICFTITSFLKVTDRKVKLRRLNHFVDRQLFIQSFAGVVSTCSMDGLHSWFHVSMGWIGFLSVVFICFAYMLQFEDPVGNIRGMCQGFYFLVSVVWWFGNIVTFYKRTRNH